MANNRENHGVGVLSILSPYLRGGDGQMNMKELGHREVLLMRMNNAFSDYSHEAEKLSVLLAEPREKLSRA